MLWENLRPEEWNDMLKKTNYTCVFNIGCMEKHGQHFAIGCDTHCGGDMVEIAAEKANICVAPRLYYGDVCGARRTTIEEGAIPGFLALSSKLLFELLEEICDECGRNGFKKVIICNSHGGNNHLILQFQRAFAEKKRSYDLFTMNIELTEPRNVLKDIAEGKRDKYPLLTDEDIKILEGYDKNGGWDGHGGFVEAAYYYAARPQCVRLDKCEQESGYPTGKINCMLDKRVDWTFLWNTQFPNNYDGYPGTTLTKTIAKTLFDIETNRVADVFSFVKENAEVQALIDERRK